MTLPLMISFHPTSAEYKISVLLYIVSTVSNLIIMMIRIVIKSQWWKYTMTFCTEKKLRCILDFERSRNQRRGSEFFLGKWIL